MLLFPRCTRARARERERDLTIRSYIINTPRVQIRNRIARFKNFLLLRITIHNMYIYIFPVSWFQLALAFPRAMFSIELLNGLDFQVRLLQFAQFFTRHVHTAIASEKEKRTGKCRKWRRCSKSCESYGWRLLLASPLVSAGDTYSESST